MIIEGGRMVEREGGREDRESMRKEKGGRRGKRKGDGRSRGMGKEEEKGVRAGHGESFLTFLCSRHSL